MIDILEGEVLTEKDGVRIYLSFVDEGYYGDYDESNPDDEPLLRVDAHFRDVENDDGFLEWNDEAEASMCTGISARITKEDAQTLCDKIMDIVLSKDGVFENFEYCLVEAVDEAALIL